MVTATNLKMFFLNKKGFAVQSLPKQVPRATKTSIPLTMYLLFALGSTTEVDQIRLAFSSALKLISLPHSKYSYHM